MKLLENTKFILLFLIFLSLITIDYNIKIINSDLLMLGPSVEKMIDNSLYANDFTITVHKQIYPDGFKYLILIFTIITKDQGISNLILSIIFKILFVLSMYKLLLYLLKDKKQAFLGAALSILTYHGIPGWQFGIAQIVPQMLVDTFYPLMFYLTFKSLKDIKYIYYVFIITGILFYIHPLSIPPLLLFIFIIFVFYGRKEYKHFILAGLLFLVIISPAIIKSKSATFFKNDELYFNIVEKRVAEVHLPELSFGTIKLILLSFLGLLGYYFKEEKNKEDKAILYWIIGLIIVFFILSLLMKQFKLLYSIEPTRYPRFLILFSFIYLAPLLKKLKKISKIIPLLIILLLFILSWQFSHIFLILPGINNVFCSSLNNTKNVWSCMPQQQKITYPKEVKQVCEWLKENTQKDDVITVPLSWGERYRYCSKRAIITSWKDGGISILSREAAFNWIERYNLANDAYSNNSVQKFREIKNKYNSTYIVTENSQKLNFTILYRTNNSYVYKIT